MKFAPLLLAPLLAAAALSACSGQSGSGNDSAPAAPVAATAPPAGKQWTDVVSKTPEGYVVGNPNAPIKVVEYGSRLCPACRALATEGFAPLMKNYVAPGKISFEFREFLIHGASDLPPALIGGCGGPAPFFPMLEQMYANQNAFLDKLQALPKPVQDQIQAAKPQDAIRMLGEQMGIIDFAKQRGIPEAKARQCLSDMTRIDALTKQTQDKGADGTVTGTPTVIVNGTKVEGYGWADVEKALKRAGA